MKLTMIEGLHLTATNKSHIAQMLGKDMRTAGTKALRYEITDRDGDMVKLIVAKREVSEITGKKFWRTGRYTVRVS
jgi:hypothetical protein